MDKTLEILFYICLVAALYQIILYLGKQDRLEGFTQSSPFESKTDGAVYDAFTTQYYEDIHKTRSQSKFDMKQIVALTQPSKESSVFLDVGSGTGQLVHRLTEAGFRAFGMDASEAMVSHASEKYPRSEYKCGQARDTMQFDPNTFSHVLCTHFTLYEIEDKAQFFVNCFRWLKIGGYLIVHLVDKDNFDTVVPVAKLPVAPNAQSIRPVKNSAVDFTRFHYTNKYVFQDNNRVKRIESFVDKATQNTRHNEQTLFMEPVEDIVVLAKRCGFHPKGLVSYENYNHDPHQYLYVLEKIDV